MYMLCNASSLLQRKKSIKNTKIIEPAHQLEKWVVCLLTRCSQPRTLYHLGCATPAMNNRNNTIIQYYNCLHKSMTMLRTCLKRKIFMQTIISKNSYAIFQRKDNADTRMNISSYPLSPLVLR